MDGDQGARGAHALTRRSLIAAGATAAAAYGGSRWLGLPSPAPAAAPKPYAKPLRIPREIRSSEITLTAKPGEARILPGSPTRTWAYEGEFPGPTIRRPAGAATEVRFRHALPRGAGELTLHLHGGHNAEADDGQPGAMSGRGQTAAYCRIRTGSTGGYDPDRYLVKPGRSRSYSYESIEDGEPERPATQWYHDHRCGETARNIWRGLAGMWIVDAPSGHDEELGLPTGNRDVPLIIGDRSFDRRNQFTDPFRTFPPPPQDGTNGRYVLVNGRIKPHLSVAPTTYRFRVLNASLFRSYNLALPGDTPFTLVASEAGLLTAPRQLTRLLLGPGERAEIVIDFSGLAGASLVLSSANRSPGPAFPGFGSQAYRGALMQFRVSSSAPPAAPIAPVLGSLPAWSQGLDPDAAPDVTWKLGIDPLARSWGFAAIRPDESQDKDVKGFDPGRVDYTAALDTTQVWRLSNPSSAAHLVHLHHTDWYVLRRERIREDGSFETVAREPLDGLKETFFLDTRESIVVAGRLSDHRGRFIVHCHMLDHEDHGLMATFEVV
ncbi:multicopper oxidase family protein [Thermoleophilia bacterium SCSIO 60948]|nr:multicopper oxidase family protein [Thermoleophilia bacterium SCSIO 60948]